MEGLHEQFIVDESGKKKAVILPIEDYEELLEDLHDLAVIADRIEPVKEKAEHKISFPNILRIDHVYKPQLSINLEKVKPLELDPYESITEAELAAIIAGKPNPAALTEIDLKEIGEKFRLQSIIFGIASTIYNAEKKPDWRGSKETFLIQLIGIIEQFIYSDKIRIKNPVFNEDEVRKRILIMLNMNKVIQHIWNEIRSENTTQLTPVFDKEHPIRSTADVRTWWTSKPCADFEKTHINFTVVDSKMEFLEARTINESSVVESFVKNDHLGFAILYNYQGVIVTKGLIYYETMKTHRFVLISFIIFILSLTSSTFVYAQDDISVLAKQIQQSMVDVLAYDKNGALINQGNGVFVNGDGDVITNIHVLQGAATAQVKTAYGKMCAVTGVLAQDKECDLVRVSVDIPPRIVRPLMFGDTIPGNGERIILVGTPSENNQKYAEGVVSGNCKIPAFGVVMKIISSSPLADGCNPVIMMNSEFVGLSTLYTYKGQKFHLAIHSSRVARLLEGRVNTLAEWVEGEANEWFASPEGLFNQGIFYLASEDYTNALSRFEEAGRKNPGYSTVFFFIGLCKDKPGQYQAAIEPYKRAIRINSDFTEAYSSLGIVYDKLGRYADAIEIYRQLIRIKPEDSEIHYKLGNAYRMAGRFSEAARAFKQVISLKPDFTGAYSNLGATYFNLGRYPDAIETYKQAITLKPDDPCAYSVLGAAYVKLERYAEAIDAFRQAVSIKPADARTYFMLGEAYDKSGRSADAVESYKQAIRIRPDDEQSYYHLGLACDRLGKYPEAIEAYKQAIQIKSDRADVYHMLGMAYFKLMRYAKAVEVYKQALTIDPDNAPTHYYIGLTYGILGRYQEETEAYKQAIRIKPDFAEAHYNLGTTYLNHKDKQAALEEYKILQTLDKDSAGRLFNMLFK